MADAESRDGEKTSESEYRKRKQFDVDGDPAAPDGVLPDAGAEQRKKARFDTGLRGRVQLGVSQAAVSTDTGGAAAAAACTPRSPEAGVEEVQLGSPTMEEDNITPHDDVGGAGDGKSSGMVAPDPMKPWEWSNACDWLQTQPKWADVAAEFKRISGALLCTYTSEELKETLGASDGIALFKVLEELKQKGNYRVTKAGPGWGADESARAEAAKAKAEAFVASLRAAVPEPILDSQSQPTGMFLLKNILDIRSGEGCTIVLRHDTVAFWKACITTAQDGRRVCGVGSPGVGKSTTALVALDLLLAVGITVVYLKRTTDESGWYYQFVPGDGGVMTTLFPEKMKAADIASLQESSTYFLIDPDQTSDTCDPAPTVLASVIINASPDSKHWSDTEFTKPRDGRPGGLFLYFRLWDLPELQIAQKYLPNATDINVLQRYRNFGGIPRQVFSTDDAYLATKLRDQNSGVRSLTTAAALSIARNEVDQLDTMDSTQPRSSIMGYIASDDFLTPTAVVVSDRVAELVWQKFIGDLWASFNRAEKSGAVGDAFEAYVRHLFLTEGNTFEMRDCIGRGKVKTKQVWAQPTCTEIKLSLDIIRDVQSGEKDGVIYHSVSEREPLIDFIFRVANVYYAVQVTIGQSHTASQEGIDALWKRLPQGATLVLLYAIPLGNFWTFTTVPVAPALPNCHVYVFGIPNPKDSTPTVSSGANAGAAAAASVSVV